MLTAERHDLLTAWAADQAGVVARQQLHDLGVGRDVIRSEVRARRWRIVGRVVLLHRGEPTVGQQRWIAILHLGQGAVLHGFTALHAQGLKGWERDKVHVVVPHGSRRRSLPWMTVHVSRSLNDSDTHPIRRPPTCRLARAAVDAASGLSDPRWACGLLAAVVQQRLVSPAQLRAVLSTRTRVRYRKAMLAALDDIEGGAHALGEIDLARLCRKAGLPEPQHQAVRVDPRGRRRYLDARFRRGDGRWVVVEVDGALHLNVGTWWDDQQRQNDLVLDGDIVLRYPSVIVRTRPGYVVSELRRALDRSTERDL